MKRSKTAFTIIELIFVIVILGILASVAIPKLSATRLDAKIVKTAQNIMTSALEIGSYAIANAKTVNDMTEMSNSMAVMENNGDAILTNKKAVVKMGSTTNCVTVEVLSGLTDDKLTISFGSTSDIECVALQSKIDAAKYPMVLRGQYVKQ